MTTYTVIPDGDIDQNSPLTQPLMTALRDNLVAVLEGDVSAPKLQPPALGQDGAAPLYACRAWVNFSGSGTVAIRASGNVTSITDSGVGTYTVNLTTAIQDINYAAILVVRDTTSIALNASLGYPQGVGTVPILVKNSATNAAVDSDQVQMVLVR